MAETNIRVEQAEWKNAHAALTRLARERAARDVEEAEWLVVAQRSGTYWHLGFASMEEYMERILGYTFHTARERLRVAQVLPALPQTAEALRTGELSWSTVREVTRVATADTEKDWIAAARRRTARQVEQLVRGHAQGSRPSDPHSADAQRHVLRFEVSPQVFCLFREAAGHLRRNSDARLDDNEILMLMARSLLGGPKDEGRATWGEGGGAACGAPAECQIAVTTCDRCGLSYQQGHGELVPIGAEFLEQAQCDAQILPTSHVGPRQRARQEIPPATRRDVMRRDHGRCRVPGCSFSSYVDVHHIHPRADGGTHDPDLLIVMCSAHHARVHDGRLTIEGRVSTGLTFRHADGSLYGQPRSPGAAEAWSDTFNALRHLGLKETEARHAIDAARPHVGESADTQTCVKAALAAWRTARAVFAIPAT